MLGHSQGTPIRTGNLRLVRRLHHDPDADAVSRLARGATEYAHGVSGTQRGRL